MGRDTDGVEAVRCHRTPGGSGWLNSQSQEAEESFKEDCLWHAEGGLDDDRSQCVRQDVAGQDLVRTRTGSPCRLDELALSKGKGLAPDESCHIHPAGHGDG